MSASDFNPKTYSFITLHTFESLRFGFCFMETKPIEVLMSLTKKHLCAMLCQQVISKHILILHKETDPTKVVALWGWDQKSEKYVMTHKYQIPKKQTLKLVEPFWRSVTINIRYKKKTLLNIFLAQVQDLSSKVIIDQ